MSEPARDVLGGDPHATSRRWLGVAIAGALLAVMVADLALGAVHVRLADVFTVLLDKVGIGAGTPAARAETVVWGIRVPRLLMAMTVGATLGVVGATYQGMLRNGLADPQLLAVGPGAAIGAALGSIAGGVQGAIAGGVATGVLTALVVRRMAGRASIDPTRIILSGVALGAVLSAWVGFVVFAADRTVVPPIEFWLLGSLTASTWRALGTVAVLVVPGLVVLVASARILDVLALGETEARHLGVDTDLVGTVLFITTGAAVGATVGAVGVVAFVGLLVPFAVRATAGPAHRYVLPAAAAGGAVFLATADLVARLAISPVEIPVGLVTAAVGGPVFLWLILRQRVDA